MTKNKATDGSRAEVVEDESRATPVDGAPDAFEEEFDPLIGVTIAERYHVRELIGRGGMGAVYRAFHVHMHKAVALKVLHREMTALPEVVARFEREAIAAARIEHVNVVQARDFGQLPDGAFYLVLEYVEGQPLGEVLREGTRLGVARTLNIAGQVAEALAAAHSENIVHRDLKPDNVMLVSRPGEPELVKVLDFGIAKVSTLERGESERPITKMGAVFGTPEYMAPEQAAGQAVDHRADLYALGLLIYRMLAGAPPFMADEVHSVLMMQITQQPPSLPQDVPLPVRQLVFDLLKKKPDERPQAASEVVERILPWIGSEALAQGRTRTRLASVTHAELPAVVGWAARLDETPWGRPVTLGGRAVPLWRLVAGGVVLLGAATTISLLDAGSAHAPLPPAEAAASVAVQDAGGELPPADPEHERLVGQAFLGVADAVSELERLPAPERSVREWLALASGLAKLGKPQEALPAYRAALEKDETVANNPVLLRDVWDATQSEATSQVALKLAAEFLGSKGADLLYRVWVETKQVTPKTRLAKQLVYSKNVREQASPALAFVLDWRATSDCEDYVKLLPRASIYGDQRALMVLQRALHSRQCELPEDALRAAILAVKDRPAPNPF